MDPNNKQNKMVTFSKRSSRTKAKKKNSKQRKTKKRSVKRQNGPKSKSKTRPRSQTTSKSQTVTPTKENSDERKLKAKLARVEDFREKEPSSEGKKNGGGQGEKTNESVSKSKGSQVVPSSQLVEQPPKKVEVKNLDPDEKKMKHLIKKLKKEKAAPRPPSVPLDEKSRLLMDRVVKKPYPQRYRIKSKEELLMDEKSSFFKVSVPSKRGSVSNSQAAKKPLEKEEDPYADCPKLADVLKMSPCKGVFNDKDVPFWAEYCEPTESDMAGMDHAEAVNSEHIEMLQEKKFQLKTVAEKVTLDAFQPLTILKDRDEKHFNEALVFSNTIRTVINIQNLTSDATSGQLRKREAKLKAKNSKVTIPEKVVPECYVYARSDPFTITRAPPKTTNTTNTATLGE
ncbi:unnamed protein product [Caenorhabditis brenneri]